MKKQLEASNMARRLAAQRLEKAICQKPEETIKAEEKQHKSAKKEYARPIKPVLVTRTA